MPQDISNLQPDIVADDEPGRAKCSPRHERVPEKIKAGVIHDGLQIPDAMSFRMTAFAPGGVGFGDDKVSLRSLCLVR